VGLPWPANAQPREESIGGCLIIHFRGSTTPNELRTKCNQITPQRFANGQKFQDVYSWAPPALAAAFSEAALGAVGTTNVSNEIRLTLVSNGVVNAGIGFDSLTEGVGGVDIVMTSGLLDFVQVSGSSYMLDLLRGGKDAQPGMGYAEWLNSMRSSSANKL